MTERKEVLQKLERKRESKKKEKFYSEESKEYLDDIFSKLEKFIESEEKSFIMLSLDHVYHL